MQVRTLLMSFLALIFAGSSAIGVYLIGGPQDAAEPERVPIVAAKVEIPRGTTITAEQLQIVQWPKEFVPEGAIARVEDAVDRVVAIPLLQNELISETKLAAKGTGRGLAALVPPGMRAMTILTPNVSSGVAGFVLPGNRVDVLLTLNRLGSNDRTGGAGTITLLQNVEILAVDQRIEVPSENWIDPKELRSVTLLVTPKQAAQLDLGQNKGTLSLALRNPEDDIQTDFGPATLAGLGRFSTEEEAVVDLAVSEQLLNDPAVADTPTISEPPAIAESAPKPEGAVKPDPTNLKSEEPQEAESKKRAAFLPVRTLRGMAGGIIYQRSALPPNIGN